MLPPPGFEPGLAFQDAPTSILYAVATATPLLNIGVDMPTATLSAAIATMVSKPKPSETGECELLGPFAILVQTALGAMALLVLVYKRWRERPQRPVKVWAFDASKQVVGSILVHLANLFMSMLSSGQLDISVNAATVSQRGFSRRAVDDEGNYSPNPCSFYLLNLAIDTTVGVPILICLLRIFTALFLYTPVGIPPESIESGNYGTPPRAWWWIKQSIIYFMGLMGMKICVLVIFLLCPWISRVGDWALGWTEGNVALQVAFVMFIFPVIMNATQYYIIDSFIKNQKPASENGLADEDENNVGYHNERYEDPESGSSDEINSADEYEDLLAKADLAKKVTSKTVKEARCGSGNRSQRKSALENSSKDYDPIVDGEENVRPGDST
ncbi:vacuolar membrane protein-domain-containing protein [Calycina marina]|uniref:Vacuolar membrane protein-domain-containing protein n=1 Tax=Calycina marina TaxID=1763456 RepID=A0A9P7Z3X7_9HELO|nr:vacuolar membrane protein-domain-containing protein [Calycina marina]